jgi:hypothetical protein
MAVAHFVQIYQLHVKLANISADSLCNHDP